MRSVRRKTYKFLLPHYCLNFLSRPVHKDRILWSSYAGCRVSVDKTKLNTEILFFL